MEIPEGYTNKFKKPQKKGAHRLQELIDRIIVMDEAKHKYAYWAGKTGFMSYQDLERMICVAEKEGRPQIRLFNYLLKKARSEQKK